MGWFQAPHHFGRASLQMPVDSHRDTFFYPACFVIWSDTDDIISIACEATLLQSSHPWRVHRTRMVNAWPAAEIDFCVLNNLHSWPCVTGVAQPAMCDQSWNTVPGQVTPLASRAHTRETGVGLGIGTATATASCAPLSGQPKVT